MSRSQWVFAATMAALGILGLATGGYVSIWTGVPKDLPERELLFQASCAVSLATGVGLMLQRTGAIAAQVLLAYLVIWMLCFRVYPALQAPTVMISWWPVGESAVMVGAAWIVAMATGAPSHLRPARMLYGAGLIPFGIAHFFYLKETVVLVPAWLGSPTTWAYLTGRRLCGRGCRDRHWSPSTPGGRALGVADGTHHSHRVDPDDGVGAAHRLPMERDRRFVDVDGRWMGGGRVVSRRAVAAEPLDDADPARGAAA
jgi:uncharacterized membrane protein